MKNVPLVAGTAVALALALSGLAAAQSPAPSASPAGADITALPHPAHIHTGSCANLGDVVVPLNDVTLVKGSDRVGASTTTGDMSLKDILASPHAIMTHASAQDLGTYIACADLKGDPKKGLLVVALDEQNESGFAGVAFLRADNGKTVVDLSLTAPEYPAGSEAPGGSPQPGASSAPMSMAPMSMAPASMAPVGSTSPSSAPAASGEQVTIKDFKFAPDSLTVSAGTTVTWTNQDSTQHTVTADDGSFDSGPLAQGGTFTHTFETAGTFSYHCNIHPNMKATITVQ